MAGNILAPGIILDNTYKIVRWIGAGGVGEVYEAVHTRVSGRFAVKVLLGEVSREDDVIKRFQREAEVTSALRHPNIVQVFDFNRLADGSPYLVMEFLDGVELANEIVHRGPFPLSLVVDLVGQLASALTAAHSKKVIHRDLKPQNLFVIRLPGEDREIIKILDFGISKVREATTKLTRQASILGTPQYMAPEQARGQIDEIDERTDLFSLAAITYELITGHAPFNGEAVEAILYQVVYEVPPPLPQLMPAIENVVFRGMAKNKLDRYSSVREFHQALAQAAENTLLPDPCNQTLSASGLVCGANSHILRPPTEILPGTTKLSTSEVMIHDEKTASTHSRIWLLPVFVLVAVAGVLPIFLWSSAKSSPLTKQTESSIQANVLVSPDTSLAFVPPIDAAIPPKDSQPMPEVGRPRSSMPKRKTTEIRMEDL